VAPTEGDDDPTSEGMSRDSYLNIGHATHRLLFAKRTPDGRLQHPPEQVAASVTVSEDKLLAYVVTSLPRFCPNVGGFSASLDAACEADVRMGCVPYARYTHRGGGGGEAVEGDRGVARRMAFGTALRAYRLHNPVLSPEAHRFAACPAPTAVPSDRRARLAFALSPALPIQHQHATGYVFEDLLPFLAKMVFLDPVPPSPASGPIPAWPPSASQTPSSSPPTTQSSSLLPQRTLGFQPPKPRITYFVPKRRLGLQLLIDEVWELYGLTQFGRFKLLRARGPFNTPPPLRDPGVLVASRPHSGAAAPDTGPLFDPSDDIADFSD